MLEKIKKYKRIIGLMLIVGLLSGCQAKETTTVATGSSEVSTSESSDFFTTEMIHELEVDVADGEYQAMLSAYETTGDKNWLKATVKIDGTTFKNAGIKLKGNSTLRGLKGTNATETTQTTTDETRERGEPSTLDSTAPETIPWVVRLDKYEEGVSYQGRAYFVIRANNTETSLNEALALSLLNEGGIEAEAFAFTRFSVNGSAEKLRLVLDVPDDDLWTEEHFGTESAGLLYKADGSGDYSYRGADESTYTEVFKQKYGEDNLAPVVNFLDFINNATDDEFGEKLTNYLEVDDFATYLAGQALIQNEDDIDGPGNNSYLYYNETTKKMTVVAWDHNLAFGGFGGGGTPPDQLAQGDAENRTPPTGEQGAPPEMVNGEDGERPEMKAGAGPMGGGNGNGKGMGGKDNPLVTRFLANKAFKQLYDETLAELTANLIDNDYASNMLQSYESLLVEQATDLISADDISAESKSIQQALAGNQEQQKTTKINE